MNRVPFTPFLDILFLHRSYNSFTNSCLPTKRSCFLKILFTLKCSPNILSQLQDTFITLCTRFQCRSRAKQILGVRYYYVLFRKTSYRFELIKKY